MPIIDVDGQSAGNTCDEQDVVKIQTDSWCALQKSPVPVTKEQMHAQCVGGAVVQDPLTGCPKCLMSGEEVVYEGVVKYVPTAADPVGKTSENMTLAVGETMIGGKYYSCPSKKYAADNRGAGVQCYPDNFKCDEGTRATLQYGCDEPATYSGGKWTLNTNCVYKNAAGQYVRYCGLNSWYKGYEIYDDAFTIVVR